MAPEITSRVKRVGLSLPVDVVGRDARGGRFVEGTRTLNVSGGGLCFESGHNLLVGARVDLTVVLPPKLQPRFGGHETYRVRAMVCRVERRPAQERFRIGVRFLEELGPQGA